MPSKEFLQVSDKLTGAIKCWEVSALNVFWSDETISGAPLIHPAEQLTFVEYQRSVRFEILLCGAS